MKVGGTLLTLNSWLPVFFLSNVMLLLLHHRKLFTPQSSSSSLSCATAAAAFTTLLSRQQRRRVSTCCSNTQLLFSSTRRLYYERRFPTTTTTTTTAIRSLLHQSSSSKNNGGDDDGNDDSGKKNIGDSIHRRKRKEFLDQSLELIGVDAGEIHNAAIQSVEDPMSGYDGRYGKSAIKTYRSFLYPKKELVHFANDEVDDLARLKSAAIRCAQQVDFLLKRHQSHQAEWVRHHDITSASSSENDSDDQQQQQTNATTTTTFPIILLLDNVRSAANVGSIIRTSDAAGCELVITTGISPHPNGNGAEKIRKSSLGAEYYVNTQHFASTRDAVSFLRETKPSYQIIGVETTTDSVPYTSFRFPPTKQNNDSDNDDSSGSEGTVLVLGNEVTGVDTTILPTLDAIIEIPMFGVKNSLNIAACAPIILYEIIRQININK